MTRRMKQDFKNIDKESIQRSPKFEQLLGQKPSFILRWGIVIIFAIFIIIIGISLVSNFPYGEGEILFNHIFNR